MNSVPPEHPDFPTYVRNELHEFQPFHRFCRLANRAIDRYSAREFFNSAGLNFLREAWIAGKFATSTGFGGRVRLIAKNFPDFEIETKRNYLPLLSESREYEIVEAIPVGRKRGFEYRENSGIITDDSNQFLHDVAKANADAIVESVRKKSKKRYQGPTNLVVYASSAGTYGLHDQLMIDAFHTAHNRYKASFEELWLLFDGKLLLAG